MAVTIPQKNQSKKLQQFVDEINEVCNRYQYTLQAKLDYTTTGVLASIAVADIIPEKKVEKKAVKKPRKIQKKVQKRKI